MPAHNNVFADGSAVRGLANKPTNSHNRKSVNGREGRDVGLGGGVGAGGRYGFCPPQHF